MHFSFWLISALIINKFNHVSRVQAYSSCPISVQVMQDRNRTSKESPFVALSPPEQASESVGSILCFNLCFFLPLSLT